MFVQPRILSILTTRRCTAACDHCCVSASPRATQAIPVARIHGLIDEAVRVPSIRRIVFTGGECFLLGRYLDELIAHAANREFETRTITNGYWAVNERAARNRVAALCKAGLDEMMLSTGTFHQRFVPVERVVLAARAAASSGIATRISIEACDQSTFDDAILYDELREQIEARTVCLGHDPWIPHAAGLGTARLTYRRLLETAAACGEPCAQVMTIVTVTPDQKLAACCGYPVEQLPALAIGSIAERALDDVLRDAPNDLLKMWLHVAGPTGIAEFIARHVPGYRLADHASICQACVALQRDATAMRVIAEHAGEIVQTVVTEFLQVHGGNAPVRAYGS
jgi:hypothetical protein